MVVDGQRWWTWDQEYGARYGTGMPQQMSPFTITGLEALLDPRALLATMRGFSLGDTRSVAGREAIPLHARYGGHGDELFDTEIAVDAERGVALRVVERFDGEIVEVRELTSVHFDVPIDAEVFTFAPPHGEEPLPLPVSGSVTVEEAAVVCPFNVYVPDEIPDGAEVELTYCPGWQRDPLPGPTFSVHVRHDRHLVWIEQWEGFRCCLTEPSPPQAAVRNGQTVFVSTDSNGWHSIETRRGGTGIELRSTGDLELLVSDRHLPRAGVGDRPAGVESRRSVEGHRWRAGTARCASGELATSGFCRVARAGCGAGGGVRRRTPARPTTGDRDEHVVRAARGTSVRPARYQASGGIRRR